jgi:hypothetical protein
MAQPDKFDWVIAGAREAERALMAKRPLKQYELGILTVEDLRDQLTAIIETVPE